MQGGTQEEQEKESPGGEGESRMRRNIGGTRKIGNSAPARALVTPLIGNAVLAFVLVTCLTGYGAAVRALAIYLIASGALA